MWHLSELDPFAVERLIHVAAFLMCEVFHLQKTTLPFVIRHLLHHSCRMKEGDLLVQLLCRLTSDSMSKRHTIGSA